MSEILTSFYSPEPKLIGKIDLSSLKVKTDLNLIRAAAAFDQIGLEKEGQRNGSKIVATWARDEYDRILGSDSEELNQALIRLKDEFEAIVKNQGLNMDEIIFSASWTLPDSLDGLTDTLHADNNFVFCALSGLPIEYYVGEAKGMTRRHRIDKIQLPEGAKIEPSNFGDILKFTRMSVHRRGIGYLLDDKPVLRMAMRATIIN